MPAALAGWARQVVRIIRVENSEERNRSDRMRVLDAQKPIVVAVTERAAMRRSVSIVRLDLHNDCVRA